MNKVWILALLGAIFYWLSLPPMKFPWAAYLAVACWVAIVAKECSPTRREYWQIWFAGFVMWLALLQGIRLAFWPLYLGWMTLSAYVAIYLPLFIGTARLLNKGWRLPLPIATCIAWVGLELIRAYFATGFAACMLAHSQTPWPWMLPIAAHLGGYGVSLIVVLVGTLVYQWFAWFVQRTGEEKSKTTESSRLATNNSADVPPNVIDKRGLLSNVIYTAIALSIIGASAGSLILHDRWLASREPIQPLARVLLVQDDMPTLFDVDDEGLRLGWQRYEQQNANGARVARSKGVDLVVWPESTFGGGIPWIDWDKSPGIPPEFEADEVQFQTTYDRIQRSNQAKIGIVFEPFQPKPPHFLVGCDVVVIRDGKLWRYNAALALKSEDLSTGTFYGKQHLVMFGEYIPVLSSFPSVMKSFGLGQLSVGKGPVANTLANGVVYSTSVCFENVVPQRIHQHVKHLRANGSPPDMLVNITNDAWFRGSSILDHHLNNGILAAVENRRPMLIAANQGISAWIDGDGRVVRSLPRLDAGSIIAEPIADGRWGLWQEVGDWPARVLAIIVGLSWLVQWRMGRRNSKNH
jgi:apolipoprotein N-acyltransferase